MLAKTQAVAEVRNMEQKPAGEPVPPTDTDGNLMVPIQESQGEQQEKLPTSSVPLIMVPPEDPVATTPVSGGDPLMSNTDFVTLKQFVDGRKSLAEGQKLELSSAELVK